ncbi:carbohydrate ABC transporter permease [Maritimibacter alexandrii]|uniref:carbohydrate ABC transporter permease n=1 Tax=Maritimibacter alexandrii TaxID=2570355 RepID=UPI001108CF71|nr:sugar ABC transporter permease [Maritimibacter alexandrii]
MATKASRTAARAMISPSVILLLGWMLIPLGLTIYFSLLRYNLLMPGARPFVGWENYEFFITNPAFATALINTLLLVGGVLLITVIGGVLLALLLNLEMWGQGIVRILVIAPFFVMPTVSALVWKNMFMNPVNGLFGYLAKGLGLEPFDFLSQAPLASIIGIVSWQWLPFATLILLTAIQSLDSEQLEAAEMDGAGPFSRFFYITLPHLARAITVVVLIQTIFLLSIFAEIFVTTNGGPGNASTNLTFLIYKESLLSFDVGAGSAGGVIAIILANIVAIFLMRMIGKNLDA